MKTNESSADRIVRVVLGIVLAALAATGTVTGALAIATGVVAAIALVTGVVGFCPLYAIFRFSTKSAAR
jgi:TRAP-type mannitol/chloroaromatic compound transport system permease large subunit